MSRWNHGSSADLPTPEDIRSLDKNYGSYEDDKAAWVDKKRGGIHVSFKHEPTSEAIRSLDKIFGSYKEEPITTSIGSGKWSCTRAAPDSYIEDIKKIIHYRELLLELEYGTEQSKEEGLREPILDERGERKDTSKPEYFGKTYNQKTSV